MYRSKESSKYLLQDQNNEIFGVVISDRKWFEKYKMLAHVLL